jgi:hypothetical protein
VWSSKTASPKPTHHAAGAGAIHGFYHPAKI